MKIRRTAHFDRNYARAPPEIQQAFDKQSLLLLQNPRHPSLRAKKYDEGKDYRIGRGGHFSSIPGRGRPGEEVQR